MKEKLNCRHNWIPLLGRAGKKNIPTSLFTCLKCGEMKVGTRTIRMSKARLDMGNLPIRSVSEIGINPAPAADHAASGIILQLTAGAAMNFGDVGYVASTGKVLFADADAIATSSAIVMCVDASIALDASGDFLIHGIARDDTWAWTVGGLIYITITGTTGNTLSQTAPTGTNDVIQIVGVATNAARMYFSPQLVQVELV